MYLVLFATDRLLTQSYFAYNQDGLRSRSWLTIKLMPVSPTFAQVYKLHRTIFFRVDFQNINFYEYLCTTVLDKLFFKKQLVIITVTSESDLSYFQSYFSYPPTLLNFSIREDLNKSFIIS